MRILSLIMFISLILVSCASDPASSYVELDLLSYGVPLKIMAPDSADVKKEDWISQQGITIIKDDFDVQLWASDATTTDIASIKAEKIDEVKSSRIFSKIVKEDDNGFLFESKIDSTTYYGFYHIIVQGDNEYTFQNGLRGNFTLEQAERMYNAVKPVVK